MLPCANSLMLLTVILGFSRSASAFTSYPDPTLAELVDWDGFVAVATMTEIHGKGRELTADFRIECFLKQPANAVETLKVRTNRKHTSGRRYLIHGVIKHGELQERIDIGPVMNDRRVDYIHSLPHPDDDRLTRLQFYLHWLEDDDEIIAEDARLECSDIVEGEPALLLKVVQCAPVDRLRTAIMPGKGAAQNSLYGVVLGLRGNPVDCAQLESLIYDESAPDFSLGLDGVITGYLLLKGEEGLGNIEQSHMGGTDRSFAQCYSAMRAIRFLWNLNSDQFTKERLKQAMRLMLNHPHMPDLAVADLARWKDWTVLDRVKELCHTTTEEHGARKAVRMTACIYFDAAMKSSPDDNVADKRRIARAQEAYDDLKELDAEAVKRYEKYFRLRPSN